MDYTQKIKQDIKLQLEDLKSQNRHKMRIEIDLYNGLLKEERQELIKHHGTKYATDIIRQALTELSESGLIKAFKLKPFKKNQNIVSVTIKTD